MCIMIIDKKEIKRLAIEKIKNGKTKQVTYLELSQQFSGRQVIADIVQSIPSGYSLKKYKFIHVLFLVLLCVLVFFLILSLNFAGIIWTAPMIYFVIVKKARFYGWACIGGLYGFIPGLQLIFLSIDRPNLISFIITLVLGISIIVVSIGIIVLGFFLRGKLTPSYIEGKELYQNSEGKSRLRLVFEFKD
jgi:hypothetical protein